MQHVDALNHNPTVNVLHLERTDWVLSAQITDLKISQLKEILEKDPETDYHKTIH